MSSQTKNSRARDRWKTIVGRHARDKINSLREQCFLDERPLVATIYYFPPTKMDGDVDNIVKLILDGMIAVAYPDDKHIERIVVQKFEPNIAWLFPSPSETLAAAVDMEKPCLYIRLEDDLVWKQAV